MKASSPKKKLPDNSGSFLCRISDGRNSAGERDGKPHKEGRRNPAGERDGKKRKGRAEKSHKGKQEILEMKGWENQRRKDGKNPAPVHDSEKLMALWRMVKRRGSFNI